jgi:hypothetical protein
MMGARPRGARNHHQFFVSARRGPSPLPFNPRAVGTPDGSSIIKDTAGSNARLSAIWLREGKKVLYPKRWHAARGDPRRSAEADEMEIPAAVGKWWEKIF